MRNDRDVGAESVRYAEVARLKHYVTQLHRAVRNCYGEGSVFDAPMLQVYRTGYEVFSYDPDFQGLKESAMHFARFAADDSNEDIRVEQQILLYAAEIMHLDPKRFPAVRAVMSSMKASRFVAHRHGPAAEWNGVELEPMINVVLQQGFVDHLRGIARADLSTGLVAHSTPQLREPPAAVETAIVAAAEAFSAAIDELRGIDDFDYRHVMAVDVLLRYVEKYSTEAFFELQNAILGLSLEEDLRAVLLEAMSRLSVQRVEHERYVDWIVGRALKSASVIVRWAAVTASLLRHLPTDVLSAAAEAEPIERIRKRLYRVIEKLEARRVGSAYPQDF